MVVLFIFLKDNNINYAMLVPRDCGIEFTPQASNTKRNSN